MNKWRGISIALIVTQSVEAAHSQTATTASGAERSLFHCQRKANLVLWPNSYGFDIDVTTTWPALRDLFNLWACDSHVNSARGNKFYDVSDPADGNYRSPAHTNAPMCSTDTDSWEPPDSVKGDIARAIFYMDVRYAGDLANEADLVLTDNTGSIASGSPFMGRLSTFLVWNRSDPVDATEQLRNDLVFERYQHNRNPFVDHPASA